MSTKNYQTMILVSYMVLLSILLSTCGGRAEAPIAVPAGAQAGDLVGLEPCTYEAGDGEYAADCGTLVASAIAEAGGFFAGGGSYAAAEAHSQWRWSY